MGDVTEPVVRLACRAMNTRFEVALWGRDEVSLTAAGEEALREIQRLDQQLSFYRDDSDLRELNVYAASRPVPVEPRFFALLQRAVRLSEATGGAFDPTVGPLVRCWGFAGEGGRVPGDEELRAALERVGARHLVLDEERMTVAFARDGVTLDLGAIGKGYALEMAAEILREHELPGALIHGGTSSVYGLGDGSPHENGWQVAVRHPTQEEETVATITLRDRALGVSAPHGRFFTQGGERFGHVLDPRSGRPVQGALLAAVVTASPTDADALSTALLTLGNVGLPLVEQGWPESEALVVVEEGVGEASVYRSTPTKTPPV